MAALQARASGPQPRARVPHRRRPPPRHPVLPPIACGRRGAGPADVRGHCAAARQPGRRGGGARHGSSSVASVERRPGPLSMGDARRGPRGTECGETGRRPPPADVTQPGNKAKYNNKTQPKQKCIMCTFDCSCRTFIMIINY